MTDELGSHAPKYQRIADALRRDIKAGTYAPGTRLPAETALLERFRDQFGTLSLPTLRQAIAVLRADGLISSQQGIGTFVRSERRLERRSRHRYGRARTDKQLLTSHLAHQITYSGMGTVPEHVAEASPLTAGEPVVIRRRLLRDKETGHAEEIGASYIPAAIAAGTYLEEPDVVPKALFLCVEELSGRHYTRAEDRWRVRGATPEESDMLDIPSQSTVIHLVHSAYDEESEILEVSESIWPSSRVVIIDDYDIAQSPADLEGMSDV
jgi:GntR family transcriptional regulator